MKDILSLGIGVITIILLGGLFISSGFLLLGARIAKIENASFSRAIGSTLLGILAGGLTSAVMSVIPGIGTSIGVIASFFIVALITKWLFSTTYGKALLAELLRNVLTFIIGLIVVLMTFGTAFSQCGGGETPDYDKNRIEQIDRKQKQQDIKKDEEKRKKKNAALEKAREIQGERLPEQTASLETDDFKATFTTRGGSLRSFVLEDNQYMEVPRDWNSGLRDEDAEEDVPVNLVTTNPDYELNNPLRFEIYEGLDGMLSEADCKIIEKNANRVIFRCAQPEQPVVILKKFELAREESGPFQIWLTAQVTNVGDETVSFLAGVTQTGYQHQSEAGGGMFSRQPNLLQGLCKHGEDLYREPWNSEDALRKFSGLDVKFAGVETNYFLSAMIPGDDSPTTCRAYSDVKRDREGTPLYGITQVQLRWGETELKPGQSRVFKVKNYLGPKRYQLLQTIGCDLEESVDYGWFVSITRMFQ